MSDADIARMSSTDKVRLAMEGAIPKLPAETGAALKRLLTYQNAAIMAGVLIAWAGSHAVGIGEIIDIILLGAGAIVLGWSVFEGAEELYSFATSAVGAKSERDLDAASGHFAKAVTILGLSVIQAVLLKGQAKPVRAMIARGGPVIKPMAKIGSVPAPGKQLVLSRPPQLPGRSLGKTDAFGRIQLARYDRVTAARIPLDQRRALLYHELFHRYFMPKTGPLRKLRAELRMSAYQRVAVLRYLEEALAEGFGRLKVYGLLAGLKAYRFPIEHGYITVSQAKSEGVAIGTIMHSGILFHVSVRAAALTVPEVDVEADEEQASSRNTSGRRAEGGAWR